MENIEIAPSLLSADFSCLSEEVDKVSDADRLHLDVMDGHFVPNLTFGPLVLEALNDDTDLPFDTHLMIENPEDYVERYAEAGADMLTVHAETSPHLHRTLQKIKGEGMNAGVAINPATPTSKIEEVLDFADMILVMSVNPGFGGQDFIPEVLDKVERINEVSDVTIEIDGGVKTWNARDCVEAGVDVLVAGSAIFGAEEPSVAVKEMREAALED